MSFSDSPLTPAPVRLTTDGKAKSDPVFTAGGDEVVWSVFETPTQTSLLKLRLAGGPGGPGGPGGTPVRLHPDAATSEFEATFAADGSAYAFIQSRANLNLKLVIKDVKAGPEAIYDPGGGFAALRRPTFAPDGSRIAFARPAASGQAIVSVDRKGQDLRTLTAAGLNNWPAWSPDGRSIAFASSREGDFDLYVMNADGSQPRRVLRRPGMDIRPAWSPDGRRLAFTAVVAGVYQLHLVNADGRGHRVLVADAERSDYPAWHPDGRRLVFVGERQGRSDLYLVTVP